MAIEKFVKWELVFVAYEAEIYWVVAEELFGKDPFKEVRC